MIYRHYCGGRYTTFACDVDDAILLPFRDSVFCSQEFVRMWLERQKNRMYLRCYVFVDSVLKEGFIDPIQLWADKEKDEFCVHPGVNRLYLKAAMPNLRLVAWVLDKSIKDRNEYKGVFDNIKPIIRDKNGNRILNWISSHRTAPNASDQYDFALRDESYPGNRLNMDTDKRRSEWEKVSKVKGFGVECEGNTYTMGTPSNIYKVDNIIGIYQLVLLHFFNIQSMSPEIYYRRI